MLIHLQHNLGGIEGRVGIGVQEKLLVLGQILSWSLLGQPGTVEQFSLQQGQVCLQEGNDERPQREVGGFMKFGVKLFNGEGGVHQPQHKATHSLSNLRRYVVSKLLQCGQEALQLAELPGTTGWRELLVGQRGR